MREGGMSWCRIAAELQVPVTTVSIDRSHV
jgi:hypothetical protein